MNPNGVKLFALDDVHGIYADAFVTDQTEHLLFGSFWGRDTSIQELIARLTLPSTEGGLYRLHLVDQDDPGRKHEVLIGNADRLVKMTGRMPKANLFGDVAQVWLYDRLATDPDYGSRRAVRLFSCDDADPARVALESDLIWGLFKDVCHLPLLDPWRETIVRTAVQRGWVSFHAGIGIHALMLNLGSEELESVIETLIRDGQLTLAEAKTTGSVNAPFRNTEAADIPAPRDAESVRLTASQLAHRLNGFTGTTMWYRHALVRTLTYTDGVRFFADNGGEHGAYWFLDLVATEFYPLLKTEPFLLIVLSVMEKRGRIRVEDGNGRIVREKDIDYTDLQTGDWRFYLTDEVLLLPSEY